MRTSRHLARLALRSVRFGSRYPAETAPLCQSPPVAFHFHWIGRLSARAARCAVLCRWETLSAFAAHRHDRNRAATDRKFQRAIRRGMGCGRSGLRRTAAQAPCETEDHAGQNHQTDRTGSRRDRGYPFILPDYRASTAACRTRERNFFHQSEGLILAVIEKH